MRFIKNSILNLFSYLSGSNWSLSILLLIVFSVKTFAQIHVSDNTLLSIKEGTVFYVESEKTEITYANKEKAKIYITQNTKVTNLLTDPSVEIVYLKNEKPPKKFKQIANQKKTSKPSQPPMVKKDTEPEKKSVLFTSRGKSPASSLFYAGSTSTIAFINTGNFSIKNFSQSKANNNSIHTFFLNDAQPISTAFTDVYLQHQIHLENQITRPPPCHSVRV